MVINEKRERMRVSERENDFEIFENLKFFKLYLHQYFFFPAINTWQRHHHNVLVIMKLQFPAYYSPLQQELL